MSEPLSAELEAKAQELARRIHLRSEQDILEMARRLVVTTDETLFGNTEFALRDHALTLVAHAYAEHLPQKVDTSAPPSTAPTAGAPQASTATVKRKSKASAGPSRADEPTIIAEPAAKPPAPGTNVSD